MKPTIFFVAVLLAAYQVNGLSNFLNGLQQPADENGDMSLSPRSGGSVAPSSKYPFVGTLFFSTIYVLPCLIVNNYFCVGVMDIDPKATTDVTPLKLKTGVDDVAAPTSFATEHYLTSVVGHPKRVEKTAEYLLGVVKVCPPFDKTPLTFPTKDEVLGPDTSVLMVGYDAAPDGSGKQLLREVSATVKADADCITAFAEKFVAGKSICTSVTIDSGATKVEIKNFMVYSGKVYGVVFNTDDTNNAAMVQAFSHELDWIAANTVPL